MNTLVMGVCEGRRPATGIGRRPSHTPITSVFIGSKERSVCSQCGGPCALVNTDDHDLCCCPNIVLSLRRKQLFHFDKISFSIKYITDVYCTNLSCNRLPYFTPLLANCD